MFLESQQWGLLHGTTLSFPMFFYSDVKFHVYVNYMTNNLRHVRLVKSVLWFFICSLLISYFSCGFCFLVFLCNTSYFIPQIFNIISSTLNICHLLYVGTPVFQMITYSYHFLLINFCYFLSVIQHFMETNESWIFTASIFS